MTDTIEFKFMVFIKNKGPVSLIKPFAMFLILFRNKKCPFTNKLEVNKLVSKRISNDQEMIHLDPTS